MQTTSDYNPFSLQHPKYKINFFTTPLENILQLNSLNILYHQVKSSASKIEFIDNVLNRLSIRVNYSASDLTKISPDKKIIVIANHPFGGIEGLIIYKIISQVRTDFKIMANYLLQRIPELADIFISVDPFGKKDSIKKNIQPLKQTINWLKADRALGIFPAGEVSSVDLSQGKIHDPDWNTIVASLAEKTQATIIPVYFEGNNSALFNILGLAHPGFRTAMLPREFLNKANREICVQIGNPILPEQLNRYNTARDKTRFLRMHTYLLSNRYKNLHKVSNRQAAADSEIAHSKFSQSEIELEIKNLNPETHLFTQENISVFCAEAEQIPSILNEIGRLREITFRSVNEGSGKDIDIDSYDEYYRHLFLWDNDKKKIAGAYRLGLTDSILKTFGRRGLYTFSLFKMNKKLFTKMSPAIELGRSFIIQEYQKSFAPLLLLWKGIGHFIAKHPKYRYLFGPVSISNTYTKISRGMIIDYMKSRHAKTKWSKWVKPRNRFSPLEVTGFSMKKDGDLLSHHEDLNSLISLVENKDVTIPVLLKQYLKLNGKILGFNIDHDFHDALDALIVVDLHDVPKKSLKKYMGENNYTKYLDFNKQ